MRSASERISMTPPVLTYVSCRMRRMTTSFSSCIGDIQVVRAEAKVPATVALCLRGLRARSGIGSSVIATGETDAQTRGHQWARETAGDRSAKSVPRRARLTGSGLLALGSVAVGADEEFVFDKGGI